MVRIGRPVWDRIYERCEVQPHNDVWDRVSQCRSQTTLQWWQIMGRAVDQAWRVFSPEVSGNRL
jgi:hypothetical protein